MLERHPRSPPNPSGSANEFKYSQADFRAIADVLKAEAGISLPDNKAPLVYARLVKRLRTLNLSDFADYVALLQVANAGDERRFMLTALTTNVTRFFREPHHLEHLRANVLAPLKQAQNIERFRLWSAACSTGQEAYSVAAVVAQAIPNAARMGITDPRNRHRSNRRRTSRKWRLRLDRRRAARHAPLVRTGRERDGRWIRHCEA